MGMNTQTYGGLGVDTNSHEISAAYVCRDAHEAVVALRPGWRGCPHF